jgi:hypothetical protein
MWYAELRTEYGLQRLCHLQGGTCHLKGFSYLWRTVRAGSLSAAPRRVTL